MIRSSVIARLYVVSIQFSIFRSLGSKAKLIRQGKIVIYRIVFAFKYLYNYLSMHAIC